MIDGFRAIADVSDVYLLDRHADTLAASNWHRPDTFIGQNYTFRSYYSDAIAGREGRFYGLGVQSLERGYYFSAPLGLQTSEVTVYRNLFFDCDNGATAKEGNFFVLLNNTVVHATREGGASALASLRAAHRRARLRNPSPLHDE